MHVIGIDTGGTFTDTVVVASDGRVDVGKSFSTPPEFEHGVLDSLSVAAAARGESLECLLAGTDVVAHGTTVGLNGLLTRTGAKVGLLVTEGFESTLPLAKANKLYGLPADQITNALKWDKPPLLVPRQLIQGVRERIDVRGAVLTPLDEVQARCAIDHLAREQVEAVGISLLWSTVEPRHERRLRELVNEVMPGTPVTLSSELAPRLGEYERTSSVAVNAYVAPLVGGYLERLQASLGDRGFRGELLIMTMAGGVLPPAAAVRAPVHTLQSGPAAGLAQARRVGAKSGHRDVITTDVGGTSFDVGLVLRGELPLARRPMIERQALAVPIVDVASIGTGGGSIAWHDDVMRTLRVGPASAGSRPGPACYGRGGDRPTVTDAAAVLGYIDRLGGDLTLDLEAASAAIDRDVASRLGIDVRSAAEGIIDVAVAQMADLVRRTTIRRGHDPADFVLYGFGGAAPQYVGRYAAELGVRSVVIPYLAAEFSAAGAAMSDLRCRVEREVAPCPLLDAVAWLSVVLDELTAHALAQLGSDASPASDPVEVDRRIGLRFYRQLHAIEIDLPGPVDPAGGIGRDELVAAADEFRSRYEEIVGAGASSADTPVELVSASVVASRALPVPGLPPRADTGGSPEAVRWRTAWFGGEPGRCPVYDWDDIDTGTAIIGPAFVESPLTTAVVYPGQSIRSDDERNLLISIVPPADASPATQES